MLLWARVCDDDVGVRRKYLGRVVSRLIAASAVTLGALYYGKKQNGARLRCACARPALGWCAVVG